MKAILIILSLVVILFSPSWGEIYKWTDKDGTIHYTNIETTSQNDEKKNEPNRTEAATLQPEEKTKTPPREASQFCYQARRLKLKLEKAQAQYSAYSMRKDIPSSQLEYLSQSIASAQKELEDFEQQARKNGIPGDWLTCQFK